MKLPDHNPLIQCAPDAMHTIKDVLEKIFGLLTGKENTKRVQECEHNFGRFMPRSSTKQPRKMSRTESTLEGRVPYTLTKAELTLADQRALSIITPSHVDFKPTAMFLKPTYHKSHDWKQVRTSC